MLQSIDSNFKNAVKLKDIITGSFDTDLNHYSLIYAIYHDEGFLKLKNNSLNVSMTCVFTNVDKANDYLKKQSVQNATIKPVMLGRLIEIERSDKTIKVLAIDPESENSVCELLFVPFSDKLTRQNLLSPSDEAISLLSIDKTSHYNMGAETVFFSLTNKHLPESGEERIKILEELVQDLAFIVPRLSLKKGSFNVICLILNLENYLEEKAFIREYETFDKYTDTIFVTSELKLLTGKLEEIPYDGSQLEGVYRPIYEHQLNN